jgi:IS30 family transposase
MKMILTMNINAYTIEVSIIHHFNKMNSNNSFQQLSDFEKGRIVQGNIDGQTQKYLACMLGKNQSSISRFLKHYNTTGDYQRVEGSGKRGNCQKVMKIISFKPSNAIEISLEMRCVRITGSQMSQIQQYHVQLSEQVKQCQYGKLRSLLSVSKT